MADRNIEAKWGYGSEQHDKGTEFEDNERWYLFIKMPNKKEGECLEQNIYSYFNCPGAYANEDGY